MMKCLTFLKYLAIAEIIVLFLFAPSSVKAANAKFYQITQAEIVANLRANGDMEVTESRTYKFVGPYSYAYREMPKNGTVQFDDFRVAENDSMYRLSDSRQPGTYQIINKPHVVQIRWFFRASNESRTFEFHYRATNVIKRYADAAVLYYKFISEEWSKGHEEVMLMVIPPEPIEKTQLHEWLHGPLWAESQIIDNGTIRAWCQHLPAHTFLEIRALYPPHIFAEVKLENRPIRTEIMRQEARWVADANRQQREAIQRQRAKERRMAQGKWIVPLTTLLGLLLAYRLFRIYGQRPRIPQHPKISSEVPEKIPPALLSYLLYSKQITGGAVVGTLLHLATRGFLVMREEQSEKRTIFGRREHKDYFWELEREALQKRADELQEYELELLHFLFDDLAEGRDSISLKKIKKKQRKFFKFFKKWQKAIKEIGDRQAWYDRACWRGFWYVLGISLAMDGLTAVYALLFGLWAIMIGVAAVVVLIMAVFIPHRTREGEMLTRQWRAVKRYLQKYHFRTADRADLLTRLNDYFVYAVVLGINKKVLQELAGYIPVGEYHHYVSWYVYHGTGTFSPESFGTAFSTMIATTTSTMSTASGTGGGATAGGGGGVSSGGGGAG